MRERSPESTDRTPQQGPRADPVSPPPGATVSGSAGKMLLGATAPDPGALAGFGEPESPRPAPGPSRGIGNLVIVESPAKARTIAGYLGPGYKVLATMGHVRDLPVSPKGNRFGVDTKTWTPQYEVSESKRSAIEGFMEAAQRAERIFIASDPDREGEAIAWHVETLLKEAGVDPGKVARATWQAITPDDIKAGLDKARPVDMNMVKAQEARRILDRVVGYTLSPWLIKETGLKGLSAGRVQSAALQAVVDREAERANHIPVSYGAVTLVAESAGVSFKASLTKAGGLQVVGPDKEGKPGTRMLTDEAMASLALPKKGDRLYVINADTKPGRTAPKPPFTTTTMTVAASNGLGLSTEETMKIAQKLYERGLISYHRSDSPNISEGALKMAREHILAEFGPKFAPPAPRQYKAKGEHAQEGHECVRPTHLESHYAVERQKALSAVVASEGPVAERLYDLIKRRFVASQMADKEYDSTVAYLGFGSGDKALVYKATGNVNRFDGWTAAFAETEGEDGPAPDGAGKLPPLAKGGSVVAQACETVTKKTPPKPSYTEATLTQDLERLGIGRPSTYATIFATIKNRGYVESVAEHGRNNVLKATDVGKLVAAKLKEEFPQEMDYSYTAAMENSLDQIADGTLQPETFLDESYRDLGAHF